MASDSMEYSGILTHTRDHRAEPLAVDWARRGRLAGHEVLLVANGAGERRASEATERAAAAFRPDAVVSTGYCGALAADLQIADVVVGTRAEGAGRSYPAMPLTASLSSYTGVVRTVDHVVGTAEEKKALSSEGACAVEMEAAAVAESASRLRLPFFCVRAVTDLAEENLANDFNAALRPDGHFDTMLILKGTLRHPTVRLPELLRLRRRCIQAARMLGVFFADCQF